ncbi:UDP-N-acetylmuramate:L-alanyl-gamma-D-glutamyl-meso-diaminopimelate ligase [Psychrobacter aestuarii]|uniref:UDP-N-acetylmuramate--L-alanyl-gamma-D-glutamyl-meso-2,6-diaminoheptandioate ligase n=1 Tax=Psychrobacter aestuarii TaxID=556327 RepID=A0ABP3FRL0_9GAMM|nr:UDP-N-acetylmuramate:L-alanyl-gamma-D-glutamyl-meso-diaminopimelate ligase [Psychrobacter aestuarii]
MHIHILGICGTFMGSLALIARALGHRVTGSDANVYPPMSTQLERAGVEIQEGYLVQHLDPAPDLVVVGNAMKRGMPVVEHMLNTGMRYTSGPQFLSETVLQSRHVLAVAGTHGKTTTTTMLAWILQYAGIDTGFLIGGVPLVATEDARLQQVFAHSSHLGSESAASRGYFVIEADEYDSAFFDKRSKFVHYRPRTAILNNLEFDHADIFTDLGAIQTQFHHMLRMVPENGKIIMPSHTQSLEETLQLGVWTPVWRTSIDDAASESEWQAQLIAEDGSHFKVRAPSLHHAEAVVDWGMSGLHNVNNALVAIAAAYDVGVSIETACAALSAFAGIKRRMELIGSVNDVLVYDDFAHHPTAISTTLDGAKKKLAGRRLWAVIEPRSNTMKMGVHKSGLADSAALADMVLWFEPAGLEWGLREAIEAQHPANKQHIIDSTESIIAHLCAHVKSGDAVVIMSNGGFEGIHQRLLQALSRQAEASA